MSRSTRIGRCHRRHRWRARRGGADRARARPAPRRQAAPRAPVPRTRHPATPRASREVRRQRASGRGQGVPSGYTPTQIRSAYTLPHRRRTRPWRSSTRYDDPTAEADLATYRSTFGLPPCTTANGCFTKVNQTGGTSYPVPDTGWSTEISLDLDMVSAACRTCHILLVEATTDSFANLARGGELRGDPGRVGDQQQLRRRRPGPALGLRPPRHRDHRIDR